MAGSKGHVNKYRSALYAQLAITAGEITLAALTGNGKLIHADKEIEDIDSVSEFDEQATAAGYTVFNQRRTKYLVGAIESPAISIVVNRDNSNAQHLAFLGAAAGVKMEVAMVETTADAEITADYVTGLFLGVSRSWGDDDPNKFAIMFQPNSDFELLHQQ